MIVCKRTRQVLVLHERKTRLTPMAWLMGKTAAETIFREAELAPIS